MAWWDTIGGCGPDLHQSAATPGVAGHLIYEFVPTRKYTRVKETHTHVRRHLLAYYTVVRTKKKRINNDDTPCWVRVCLTKNGPAIAAAKAQM